MLFFFPRGVLDGILNLIESVSEDFPSFFFNELLGYLIISFTSIPVIANDKNKPKCIFFFIERFF